MRALSAAIFLALSGCVTAPAGPVELDFNAHASLTADGFREASAEVAARLDDAAGWAVFPDVEDASEGCAHEGRLYRSGAPPIPVVLRCSSRPAAPAGVTYHALVILDDSVDLARLTQGALDLEGVPHVAPHDDHEPLPQSARLIVTSVRGGLLFDARPQPQRLELAIKE